MSTSNQSNIALYRKYRPEEFNDVLGQDHIIQALEGALKQNNIAHAYLFSGSRGTGKTSVARILARKVGCTDKDLYEIDAASNRGIDDIRELREAVHTLPFESPYKVYIVDEVHMLTTPAFNALLKTLEEPPRHVLFVLATTELHKLPETIVSRCQSFVFKKPSMPVLKEMVKKIAKKEGYKLEQSSADLISLLSEGSFRDDQGILQKIIASSKDKNISLKEVEKVTGAPGSTLVNSIISAVEEKDLGKGLKAVHEASENNIDMKVFIKMILQKVRAVLLLRYAPEMKKDIEEQFSSEDFAFIEEFSKDKKSSINSNVLRELLDAYDLVGMSYISQLPLELLLVKLLKE